MAAEIMEPGDAVEDTEAADALPRTATFEAGFRPHEDGEDDEEADNLRPPGPILLWKEARREGGLLQTLRLS